MFASPLKSIASILTMIAVLVVIAIAAFFWWRGQGATHQLAAAVKTAGVAVVGQQAAETKTDAQAIVQQGQQRDLNIHVIQDQNARAIAAQPGASSALDPALVSAINLGVCRYRPNSDDPRCVQMLGQHPTQLPPAG